jgi:hypothetical protein
MGGRGSGRGAGWSADKTGDMRSIDLAWLKRNGVLDRADWSSINWSRAGQRVAWIQVKAEPEGLRLSYRTRSLGESEWRDVNELIPFANTSMPFGGQRRWFVCPSCGRNCRVIYGGSYFRCRRCHGLKYDTQYEPDWLRVATKAQKIRERLGGSAALDDIFPAKPKHMHWRTYRRLEKLDEELMAMWAQSTLTRMYR